MSTATGRTISMSKSIAYFALSLVINSAGNVITLVTSSKIHPSYLGSAYWTAAEANFATAINWNLFWTFFDYWGFNNGVKRHFDRKMGMGSGPWKLDFHGAVLVSDSSL